MHMNLSIPFNPRKPHLAMTYSLVSKKDLFSVVNRIKYTTTTYNKLQTNMKKDMTNICKSNKIIIKPDKTGNPCLFNVDEYHKAIRKEVDKT